TTAAMRSISTSGLMPFRVVKARLTARPTASSMEFVDVPVSSIVFSTMGAILPAWSRPGTPGGGKVQAVHGWGDGWPGGGDAGGRVRGGAGRRRPRCVGRRGAGGAVSRGGAARGRSARQSTGDPGPPRDRAGGRAPDSERAQRDPG